MKMVTQILGLLDGLGVMFVHVDVLQEIVTVAELSRVFLKLPKYDHLDPAVHV